MQKPQYRAFAVLMVFTFLGGQAAAKLPKIKTEDLVARHIESLGAVADRRTVVANGLCQLTILAGGAGQLEGPATITSDGEKVAFHFDFQNANYNHEQFGFDGEKAFVAFMVPGTRSHLGEFLLTFEELLKEGLIGGPLTTAWPVPHLEERKAKINVRGGEKVQDKEYYRAEYRIRKGDGNLDVDLFFDPETFRLVRNEYTHREPEGIGAFPGTERTGTHPGLAGQNTWRKVVESFAQYQEAQGVSVPTDWTIEASLSRGGQTQVWQWRVLIQRITFNDPIDPKVFQLK